MRQYFLALLAAFLMLLPDIKGQDVPPKNWVGANFGSLVTSLNFTGSDGSALDYAGELNFLSGIGYSFYSKGLVVDLNLDYYRFSSSYADDVLSTSIECGYFQPGINVGYAFTIGSFPLKPRIGIGYGLAMLINGKQQTNSDVADLKADALISSTDGGLNLQAGVMIFSQAGVSMSALYNYRMGLSNIEVSTTDQKTNTSIHALLIKIQVGF